MARKRSSTGRCNRAATSDAATDPALASHYRVDAIRAHLLDMAGDHDAARTHYERAARRTLSLPEQRYLESRADRGRLTAQD